MTLYINGNIYQEKETFKKSMLVENGIITEIDDHIDTQIDQDIIDLKGATVIPGFIDAHLHLYFMAELLDTINLQNTKSLVELITAFKGKEDKISGWGFNESYWEFPILPTKYDLDKISQYKPIYILRSCFHICIVNSKVLEMMGISKDSIPHVSGGKIEVDENGVPTGVFKENARDLVLDFFANKTSPETIKNRLDLVTKLAHQEGITGMHTNDLKLGKPGNDTLEKVYYEHANAKENMRFVHQISVQNIEIFNQRVNSGWHQYPDTPYSTTGPLKLFSDGSLGARTAKLHQNYSDQETNGLLTITEKEFDTYMKHYKGQIVTHAIGDQALTVVLDAYIKNMPAYNPQRHAVIHLQVAQEIDLNRMKEYHIPAITQPIFWPSDKEMAPLRLGTERMKFAYAYQLHDQMNLIIAYSSDAPVEGISVLKGIEAALERGVEISKAIDHYTIDGAYMAHQEDRLGRLKAGYFADFIILSDNIFESDIKNISITHTYVNGKLQFQK